MKPFSIILIKILGLYLALRTLFSVIPAVFSPNLHEVLSSEWIPIFIASVLVPIVGGTALWFSAGALANKIHDGNEAKVNSTDDDLVRAGTFLIGIFLLVQHIGIVVGRYTSSGDVAYGSLLVLVVGLFMVFGTGFFSKNPRKPSPSRAGIQAGSAIALLGLRHGACQHKLYMHPYVNGAPC